MHFSALLSVAMLDPLCNAYRTWSCSLCTAPRRTSLWRLLQQTATLARSICWLTPSPRSQQLCCSAASLKSLRLMVQCWRSAERLATLRTRTIQWQRGTRLRLAQLRPRLCALISQVCTTLVLSHKQSKPHLRLSCCLTQHLFLMQFLIIALAESLVEACKLAVNHLQTCCQKCTST